MIELRGSYTWRDSFRVFLLSSRPRRGWAIAGVVILALAGWALYSSWTAYLRDGSGSPGALTFSCGVLLWLFCVYYPWVHYKAFKRSKTLSAPVKITLEDEAIGFNQETLSARYDWSRIASARENAHLYLLHDEVGPVVAIPKRFASDDSVADSVRECLRQRKLVV